MIGNVLLNSDGEADSMHFVPSLTPSEFKWNHCFTRVRGKISRVAPISLTALGTRES